MRNNVGKLDSGKHDEDEYVKRYEPDAVAKCPRARPVGTVRLDPGIPEVFFVEMSAVFLREG
jgi:hypothetical protein